MGDLTKNISQHELDCRCSNCKVTVQYHEPIINIVQKACDYFAANAQVEKVKLNITSAARCYEYNRMPIKDGGPGSNDESQHPRCSAMDIQIFIGKMQVAPQEVADYFNAQYPDSCGIGVYATFTHIDTRSIKARW